MCTGARPQPGALALRPSEVVLVSRLRLFGSSRTEGTLQAARQGQRLYIVCGPRRQQGCGGSELAISAPWSSPAVQACMDLCPEHSDSLPLPKKVTEFLSLPEALMAAQSSGRIFPGNRNKC